MDKKITAENWQRESFTFYSSFERAICQLDDDNQLQVYRAISRYSLLGEEPKVSGQLLLYWELIRPTLKTSRGRSYAGGKAKGIPKPSLIGNKNAETKRKQNKNKAKSKVDRDREIINTCDSAESNGYCFNDYWNKYHKETNKPKTDKQAAEKEWYKLSSKEKQLAVDNIKAYVDSIDSKYLKKAVNYLAGKNFNDEFVESSGFPVPR